MNSPCKSLGTFNHTRSTSNSLWLNKLGMCVPSLGTILWNSTGTFGPVISKSNSQLPVTSYKYDLKNRTGARYRTYVPEARSLERFRRNPSSSALQSAFSKVTLVILNYNLNRIRSHENEYPRKNIYDPV